MTRTAPDGRRSQRHREGALPRRRLPVSDRRRGRLRLLLGIGLALAAGGCGAPPGDTARSGPARNLVLVTVDTLRADVLGTYGGPVPTPAFDALAAGGVLVRQAFTPTPTTGPAHASLLTGHHPWVHGVLDNAVPLGGDLPTLAELARHHGLAAAAFVSSYVLHPRFGLDRGFDVYELVATEDALWRGERREAFYARGETTTARALAWLTAHRARSGTPFLLWIHWFDPHLPYTPPPELALPPTHPVDLAGKTVPPGLRGPQDLKQKIRDYRGEVRYVDAQLARLVEGLRGLGLLEETALVVTSDHGEGLGDHGILGHGEHLFEEQIRVPLLLRAPGLPAGAVREGGVQLEDLLPTALALLGRAPPADLDGRDLVPWLRGDVSAPPRAAVLGRRKTYAERPDLFFERGPGWKWIGPLDAPGQRFDLAADPHERGGAAASGPPAALAARARATRAAGGAPVLDDESRRALEALGYLEPDAD